MPARSATIESANQPTTRLPAYEHLLSAEDRADRAAYPLVFVALKKSERAGPDAQENRRAMQRAAESIPNWPTFRRLGGAHIRYKRASADGDANRAAQNAKKSLECMFLRFAKLQGLVGVLKFKYITSGHYVLWYENKPPSDAARWARFAKEADAINVRADIMDLIEKQFQLDCEAAEKEAASQAHKRPKPQNP